MDLSSNKSKYRQWIAYHIPTLLEVLEMFPNVTLPIDVLLKSLPILKPRFYSISSSPRADINKLSITVAVVQWKRENGKERVGLTSNYLAKIPPGSEGMILLSYSNHLLIFTNITTVKCRIIRTQRLLSIRNTLFTAQSIAIVMKILTKDYTQ
jgi:sulfite reductase alpha subunit-like flavoprotein